MRSLLKKIMPSAVRTLWADYQLLGRRLAAHDRQLKNLTELVLRERYALLATETTYHDELNRHGFKCYSQNNEDGILLYLFSLVGARSRRFVEFGIQDGRQCVAANLALNFGWGGLFMEGNAVDLAAAHSFYKDLAGAENLKFEHCWVTAENINEVLLKNDMQGEIDLLSIDIDGNDYWVWQAIHMITPRVVVMEYNAAFGADEAITVPYDPHFVANMRDHYGGASLAALTKLANAKNYALVGCERAGINAFFVRRDVLANQLSELTAAQAYYPNARLLARGVSVAQQYAASHRHPLVTV